MESPLDWNVDSWIEQGYFSLVIRVAILLLIGLPLLFFLARWSRRYFASIFSPQRGMIVGKIVQYTGFIVVAFMILREFGFELGPLLGAAGIVGIAVGFASQTSVSNVISGWFLIAEQPFVVGDVISMGTLTGEVLSIDTLSIKIRTFDNRFVRIPNENILKSEVITLTRFPIRRANISVSVAYKEDLEKVKEVLLAVADKNPLCLQEPEPILVFEGFGASSIDYTFGVWAAREDWLQVKNELYETIKRRFDEEEIEIPFPHVSLYAGSTSEPISISSDQKLE